MDTRQRLREEWDRKFGVDLLGVFSGLPPPTQTAHLVAWVIPDVNGAPCMSYVTVTSCAAQDLTCEFSSGCYVELLQATGKDFTAASQKLEEKMKRLMHWLRLEPINGWPHKDPGGQVVMC